MPTANPNRPLSQTGLLLTLLLALLLGLAGTPATPTAPRPPTRRHRQRPWPQPRPIICRLTY